MYSQKIPVTVISGFLGAGKTTLVNHLIEHTRDSRIGVVVNEYGDVGIDGELIVHDPNAVIEIRNGCICCTVRTDLVAAVKTLLNSTGGRLDRLVIETSGLADPAPVLQSFLADQELLQRVALESVVTVIDARHFHRQIDDEIAREQIAFADMLILNKSAAVSTEETAGVLNTLRQLNPAADLVQTNQAVVDPTSVFGTPRFSLPALLEIEPSLLVDEHEHEHDASISSCSIVSPSPIDADRFHRWINTVVQAQGSDLMRMKAVLHLNGEARRFVFHGVHMLVDGRPGPRWGHGEERISRMVWIGRRLNAAQLRSGFLQCTAVAAPSH